jgi:5-carboxymethyl-2-hydroxymuconate isomerase
MPNIIVEYSANLSSAVSWPDVLKSLQRTAGAMPELPTTGLRTRAYCCDHAIVSDGEPENAFVHAVLRMGHGRSDEAKQRIGEGLFGSLSESLAPLFDARPLSLTFEIQEIHPVFNFRKSNLKDHMDESRLKG